MSQSNIDHIDDFGKSNIEINNSLEEEKQIYTGLGSNMSTERVLSNQSLQS
jgi:hypothetical protein